MINFSLTVDDAHLEQIDGIAKKLEAVGCKIDRIGRITGFITGSVSDISLIEKSHIEGISQPEIQRRVTKK